MGRGSCPEEALSPEAQHVQIAAVPRPQKWQSKPMAAGGCSRRDPVCPVHGIAACAWLESLVLRGRTRASAPAMQGSDLLRVCAARRGYDMANGFVIPGEGGEENGHTAPPFSGAGFAGLHPDVTCDSVSQCIWSSVVNSRAYSVLQARSAVLPSFMLVAAH